MGELYYLHRTTLVGPLYTLVGYIQYIQCTYSVVHSYTLHYYIHLFQSISSIKHSVNIKEPSYGAVMDNRMRFTALIEQHGHRATLKYQARTVCWY